MKTQRLPLLILLSLLCLCTLALPQAADFREAKKQFLAAFKSEIPPEERMTAVAAVAAFDYKDAAKLLVSGIGLSQEILEPLQKLRLELVEGDGWEIMGRDPAPELQRLKDAVDAELKVQDAIFEGLVKMNHHKVMEYFVKEGLFREKHWRARETVALVLVEKADPETIEPLSRALRDKDAHVRTAAATALGKMKATEATEDLADLLKDRTWTVRAAAIDALGAIGTKDVVEPLIGRVGKENGRILEDLVEILARLTGQKFGPIPESWERWWEEHKEEYLGDPEFETGTAPEAGDDEEPGPDDENYYGLPIRTNKAVFIIDISESMSYSAVEYQEKPKPGEISRLELAKRELLRALRHFGKDSSFSIIAFNNRVFMWRKGLVAGVRKNRDAAEEWVRKLRPSETTNIYAALEVAFRMAGTGADKDYALGADTIFLMSDGSPTNADASVDDWTKITRAVRKWNHLGRIRIHTIGLLGHNVEFMSQLAAENGGRYVSR
jgi:HEAT repeats/von Willebrand factor type A domain/PBS lyase HEAT-like repeat